MQLSSSKLNTQTLLCLLNSLRNLLVTSRLVPAKARSLGNGIFTLHSSFIHLAAHPPLYRHEHYTCVAIINIWLWITNKLNLEVTSSRKVESNFLMNVYIPENQLATEMRAGGRDPFSCTVTKDLIHVSLALTAITLSAVPRNLDKQLFTLRSLRSLRENRYLLSCSKL